jgi:quercetin dioxygenase-like cupin family protein
MTQHFFRPGDAAAFIGEKMNKVNLYESPRMFCDVYCLKPGQFQKAHEHDRNDKLYYALTGTCHVLVGEETKPLHPGELAVAPAGLVHGVENRSNEDATLLVVMAPHPRMTQDTSE